MARIFLSYRRDDSADVSGRIRDRLVDKFGAEEVFTDVDSIPYGIDFRAFIDQKVAQCEVFLAVIGPEWLTASVDGQRRIDQPDDFVRLEIESALQRDIPVVPLLVRHATMPAEEELSDGIHELAYRHGTPIRSDHFHADMDRLLDGLATQGPDSRQPSRSDKAETSDPRVERRPRRVPRGLLIAALGAAALAAAISLPSLLGDRVGPGGPDLDSRARSGTGDEGVQPPPSKPAAVPIEQIRTQVIIRAGRDPAVIDEYRGKERRHYSVWIQAPQGAMRQVARVEYRFPEKLFSPAVVSSADPVNGFRYTYLGIGAVYDMDVVVILHDDSRISYDFNMHSAIFGSR